MSSQATKLGNRALPPTTFTRLIGSLSTIRVRYVQDTKADTGGEVATTGSPYVGICIHVGPPALVGCRRGDERHTGTALHGDIDLVPPNTDCLWQVHDKDAVLVVGLNPALLTYAAEESGADPNQLFISNRFQFKDPQLENLCWAVRDEMEAGYPSGKVYTDSLATALAARIVHHHSSLARNTARKLGKISPGKLRQVMAYIEDRLGENLSLADIADYAGMSASHFKVVFREATGQPVHRYIVLRRVERAAWLLKNHETPIAEIALATGFAHQSHLALQMRRILGQSPKDVRKNLC
jgi:AraC family transcriptional regulator